MNFLYSLKLIFIFLFGINELAYSQDQIFKTFLELFQIDTLPFNCIQIRNNNNFIDNKAKYKLPKKYVIKYLIKDTNELIHPESYESSKHEGEFEIRYFETDFYAYCQYSIRDYYFIIYNKEDGKSDYYLVIFDMHGNKMLNRQLNGEGWDTYFFESKINTDLSIEKVTYKYIENSKTEIKIETYEFDRTTNIYKLINTKINYSKKFYYDYVNHKLDDDPFKIVEK